VKYYIKIRNLAVYIVSLLELLIIKLYPVKTNKNSLMVIRLDSIGDYVLFRNYLEVLKNSSKYKGYSITLCGNTVYKEIAEKLDSKAVDKFIWVNRKKFYSNIIYKFQILKQIRGAGFEVIINPTYTREILYGDMMVRAAASPVKIGSSGAVDKHLKWKLGLFGKSIYNIVIPAGNKNMFEFYRNKEFFTVLLNEEVKLDSPSIQLKQPFTELPDKKYAVVFIGANDADRQWNLRGFAEICSYLAEKYGLQVIIAGGEKEKAGAAEITSIVKSDMISDYTGKTLLTQLIALIQGAAILTANETSAVHFAAGVKTPFVCINKGKHLGRFSPYPKEIFDKGINVYPPVITENFEEIINNDTFRFDSNLNINQITAEEVKRAIDKVLQNK
jgi:ADP-heptose:LPS heptosyltransferase